MRKARCQAIDESNHAEKLEDADSRVRDQRIRLLRAPDDSHVFQLAAYCLLVEAALETPVPYGILRYSDAKVIVIYTSKLRDELLDVMEEIRAARLAQEVHRSHDERGRCANCWMRSVCDEAL